MHQNKTVLILGNFWPYVRGGHRIAPLSRNLKSHGWDVVIVTLWDPKISKPSSLEIPNIEKIYYVPETNIEKLVLRYLERFHLKRILKKLLAPKRHKGNEEGSSDVPEEEFLRGALKTGALPRIVKFFQSLVFFPDEYFFSRRKIKLASQIAVSNHKPDIILSEFPKTFHLVAKTVSANSKIPWVADFVNLWSQNFNYGHGKIRYCLEYHLEQIVLKHAASVVTVSPAWQEAQMQFNTSSICIEHSYRHKLIPAQKTSVLNILYAGRIYPNIQNYELIFYFLAKYLKQYPEYKSRICINFVGEGANLQLQNLTNQYDLSANIHIQSRVSPDELLALKKDCNALMLFSTNSSIDGWYTSKLFDYLGAARPIIAMGAEKNNIIAKFVEENNLGAFIATYEGFQEVVDHFFRCLDSTGLIESHASKAFIDQYSESNMSSRFAELFNSLVRSSEV